MYGAVNNTILCVADTLAVAEVSAEADLSASAGSPAKKITRAELQRRGLRHIHEAVRTISGISVKDYGGIGGLKTVSVRNMGAAHTTVGVDGFVISDIRNGQTDIGRFGTDNIERITVSIGQDDEIFQSARMMTGAGTLKMTSRRPADNSSNMTVRMTAGSFGTYNPYIRFSGKGNGEWSMSSDAGWIVSKGDYPFVLRNGNKRTEEVRLGSDVNTVNAGTDIYGPGFLGKILVSASERGLPGPVVLYTQNPTERLWDRDLMAAVRYEDRYSDKWRMFTSASYSCNWNRYTDTSAIFPVAQDDSYLQQEIAANAVMEFSQGKRFRSTFAQDLFVNILDSDIPECLYPRRLSSITALSGQYTGERIKATATIVGIGIREWTDKGAGAPDRMHISPSASIIYTLTGNKDLKLRISYKDSYRVPTFNDLYYSRVGNISLKPEKARQINAGVTWRRSSYGESGTGRRFSMSLTADAYLNDVRDKIVAIPTMFIWKMQNVGKARMAGIDLNMDGHLNIFERMALYMSASYSLQKATDITAPGSKSFGHQLAYTPVHTANATVSAETQWLTLSYTVSAVGKRYCSGQNIPANLLQPYAEHSISISRKISSSKEGDLHISLEALNISDRNYEVIRYYPMPGINYRITLHYNI